MKLPFLKHRYKIGLPPGLIINPDLANRTNQLDETADNKTVVDLFDGVTVEPVEDSKSSDSNNMILLGAAVVGLYLIFKN